ncbi:NmrA domain-containing protein [Mycena sanguinolenta]|uniref:NmrA domain-containing protein n=1 Tax=Mycena sanguinolenta TaxID=230812 RepID=A0A8H6YZN0_9AGAR|nr:NmrA domain-containing protein [Mycena sanguinolenta]
MTSGVIQCWLYPTSERTNVFLSNCCCSRRHWASRLIRSAKTVERWDVHPARNHPYPDSEAAAKIKAQGVEVVKADTIDKSSLLPALRGCEAAFVVTLSGFPPYSAEKPSEIAIGKNIIDAAKEAGVKFIVFSSVPGLTKLTGGKYTKCNLYDDKEEIEEYLKASGILNASLHLGTFAENLWTGRKTLKKTDTGTFDISIPFYTPTSLSAFTWVGHDVGEATLALLKNYTDPSKNVSGRAYPVVTGAMTFPDLANIISKALGKEVTFTTAPPTGRPAFDEMFAAGAEYNGFYTATPVPNPDLTALGAKLATMEEPVDAEVKPRFS